MMDKEAIKARVQDFILNDMELEADVSNDNAELTRDLGMSSLDFVDIKAFLLREFHFSPVAMDLLQLKTLDDLYNYILDHQA